MRVDLKSLILGIILSGLFFFILGLSKENKIGRYQPGGPGGTILIDTQTGKTCQFSSNYDENKKKYVHSWIPLVMDSETEKYFYGSH